MYLSSKALRVRQLEPNTRAIIEPTSDGEIATTPEILPERHKELAGRRTVVAGPTDQSGGEGKAL